MSPTRPGLLVALEGIDGTGKSTQSRLLAEWIAGRGLTAARLFEPTNGPIGQEIRRLASAGRADPEREMELFIEDRLQDVEQNILPALQRGHVVLIDRYYLSTMAYQGARGLDPEEIRTRNEAFAPRPDLVLLFELTVEKALERIARRDASGPNLFERADYLNRVRAIFDSLEWKEIRRIDANRPPETVQEDARRHVESLLVERGLLSAAP